MENNSIDVILSLKQGENKKNKKRVITTNKKWNFTTEEFSNQYDIVMKLFRQIEQKDAKNVIGSHEQFIIQQIRQKLNSYKYQDQLKGIFDDSIFANSVQYILKLLCDCELKCFYCKNTVSIIYENTYDPTQWTLERIDNNHGHNFNNICISCLKCNIGRRTMHQKRYLFTKKCTNIVEFEGKESPQNYHQQLLNNITVLLEDKET
jgi:hypothetical protein